MANIVGSGDYTYEMDADWAKLPEGWAMPTAAVFGDSERPGVRLQPRPRPSGLRV